MPDSIHPADETGPLYLPDDDEGEVDPRELPTIPISDTSSDDAHDPKRTLIGSGGLDPNPDFAVPPVRSSDTPSKGSRPVSVPPTHDTAGGHTVPHIVRFQHTMVHVPGERQNYPPQQQYQPPPPGSTMPNPQQPRYNAPPPPQGTQYAPYGAPNYAPQPPAPLASQPNTPNLPPRRKKVKRGCLGCSPGCLIALAGLVVTFCGGLTLIGIILTTTLGSQLEQRLQQQIAQFDTYDNFESTFFYDRNGTLLYEAINEGRRVNVSFSDFPQDLLNATVAIEDDSFWTNPGFEVEATTRAFLQYIGIGGQSTGGSTITQQLVRNVLFSPEYRAERSVQRKVEEIVLAFLLNQQQTKEQILTLYLNEIYYGNLAYGAEAAARTFFNKSVSELTLGEAALLAGLPQAPANLDPFSTDPDIQAQVDARWRLVLDRMVIVGYISDEQRNQALRDGYSIIEPEAPLRAPHFVVYARNELESLMTELGYTPESVASGGLLVYTTLDVRVNDLAQQAAASQIAGLAGNNVSNAAVLAIQPITGEIVAMVGSVDYNNDAIDGRVNVVTSRRQPGSTVKAFTYALALEMGMTPGNVIWDTEIQIGDYRPVNYDRTFHGPVRLRSALANSYNIPAVQTLRRVGVDNLLYFLERFGVGSLGTDASQYGVSLTLGGGDITLQELTRGYGVFATGGSLVPSVAIRCILNTDNEIIYQYENGCPRGDQGERTVNAEGYGSQVLDSRIAYIISDVLGDNVARSPAMGSNSPLNTGALQTSVKTGTTDNFRDNWTVGYTQNVVVGVWVGNSSGEPMAANTSGLTGAAPIWNSVIRGIYDNQTLLASFAVDGVLQPDRINTPGGMGMRQICDLNSLRDPVSDCPAYINEWFLDGPAGLPDGQGGLAYVNPPVPTPFQVPASGPYVYEVEPDIYRALVHPIPPEVGNGIVFAVEPGQQPPPAPIYCQVPVEIAASDPSAREQMFIAPPPVPADAVSAENYARRVGLAFLPTIACSPELIGATGGGSPFVTAFISSPAPGQIVSGGVPIIGTADFSPSVATYYKVELIGGAWADWATIGDVHYNPVVNGVLENLAPLPPGQYAIQLVVVGIDGNYVQQPYRVDFTVQ